MPRAANNKLETEEKRALNAARCQAYYRSHREERKAYSARTSKENAPKLRESAKARYKANREACRETQRQYVRENQAKVAERKRNWERRQRLNPEFRLGRSLRQRVRSSILCSPGARKQASTRSLTGCSIEFLKGYLSSKFTGGMAWDNYGQ
jgi:hypothetical protein